MRRKEIVNLLKQDMNEIMPDFGVMLEKINSVEVERVAVNEGGTETSNKTKSPTRRRSDGELSPVRAERRNKAIGITGMCVAIVMIAASIISVFCFADKPAPPVFLADAETYVTVNINPAVNFTVNKNNKITSAVASNASGVVLMAKMTEKLNAESLAGFEINGAIVDTVDMAAQMGYIDVEAEGLTNAMMISVVGKDENDADEIKTGLAKETKKYFADNGIYAVVITDYDTKGALVEEAKKANPDLDENSSVGDLIASIEKENAGKSVVEAEIEAARKDYENYLISQYENNKNSLMNSEISRLSDNLRRTENILKELKDALADLENGAYPADKIGAVSTDAYAEALRAEYETKTKKYNENKALYDAERAELENALKNDNGALTAVEERLAKISAEIDANNAAIALNESDIQSALVEKESALTALENAEIEYSDSVEKTKMLKTYSEYIVNREKWLDYWNNCPDKCGACAAKTVVVNRIVNEQIYFDVISKSESYDEILWIKDFKDKTLRILAEVLNTTIDKIVEDNVTYEMVNDIVDMYKYFCLTGFDKDAYLKGTAYILSEGNPSRVETYGQINSGVVYNNYIQEVERTAVLTQTRDDLNQNISDLENAIAGGYATIATLNSQNESNTDTVAALNSQIAELKNKITANEIKLSDIITASDDNRRDYGDYIEQTIADAENKAEQLKAETDKVKNFKETYVTGGRLDGYDALCDALDELAAKFEADKAANDADAVAKNVAENIKANADRKYNENVAKYSAHDRTFSEEEYAAWESEQEKLIEGIDWAEFYGQWLKDNE